MPTNPVNPNTEAAVDRLTLGIESPRGAEASHGVVALPFACFEAEASAQYCTPCCSCIDTD